MNKEIMNLKESREGYMRQLEERKGKGENAIKLQSQILKQVNRFGSDS